MALRYRIGSCEIVPSTRQVLMHGQPQRLGGRAFDLLLTLVDHRDRVVTKEELYERVWAGVAVEPNNLQVQVWTLRQLLGAEVIATVARRGYKFCADVREEHVADSPPPPQGRGMAAWQVLQSQRWIALAEAGLADALTADLAATPFAQEGGVWRLPDGAHDLSPALHAWLARVGPRQAVLLVSGPHVAPHTLQGWLVRFSGLRLVRLGVTEPHADETLLDPAALGLGGPAAAQGPRTDAVRLRPRHLPDAFAG